MRVCIYARKSTNKINQSNTIENQIKICQRYAKQMELEVVDTKIDVGTGRNDFNRPEVKSLIQDGVKGKYQCVIIKGISRIYRNVEEGLKLIKKLHMNGIRVISIEESFDTSQNTASNGILDTSKLTMYLIMAEMESNKISERVKWTQVEKAKRGMWNNPNRVPYGYKYNNKTKKLEIDSNAARTVEIIFKMYEEGNSVSDIIAYLEKFNLKPPRSKKWREDTIRYILRNQTYVGNILYSGSIIENAHEPIIDKDIFNKIQVLLDSKARGSKNKRSRLMGLIKCESCNSSMTLRKYHYTGEYYYYCSGYIKNGKSFCSSHKIKADVLERKVFLMIKKYLKSFDKFGEMQSEFSALKKKIDQLNSKSFVFTDKYIEGKLSDDRYREIIKPVAYQIDELTKVRDEFETKIIKYRYLKNVVSRINYDKLTNLSNLEDDHLNSLIDIILITNNDIKIKFKLETNV
ncbi:recombinase family protein [Solibacillus sp. CAU 1738]|uniref:recombinase family protein n=1 Tax=Solibacillus sp. CAU 1738 TaxID=3140363 RepID=UPI003260BAED